ncbi:hypothetical protein COU01_04370 [Candidatus Falkowbacteria bacterium CG10_big_fil_rev_8_21_14_0_10_44_15]|uniref:Uncharacterized protein n=1 Tax=Candidatus Falkowbacteria bacterium CG10_big_fil_rev_8_21_14_0_10_44_15 TaxID=1974569 RepID=A0A2H0UYP2_9BACT|nr:MAG: hypothetical protein COU01_04370 [Candidatus Falkowbacteria bacterium CG10_big_fil_rev_8_21_14_0_10_44_15]
MPVEKIANILPSEKKKRGREEEFNVGFLDDKEGLNEFINLADEVSAEQKTQEVEKVDREKLTPADLANMNAQQRVEFLRQLKERKAPKSLPRSSEEEKNNRERAVTVIKEMLARPDVMAQIFGRVEAISALDQNLKQKHDLDLLLTLSREAGIHLGVAIELLDTTQSEEKLKELILDSMAKYAIDTIEVYQENNEKAVPRAVIRLPQEDLEKVSRLVNPALDIKPAEYEQLYAYAGGLKRYIKLQLSVELMAAIENSFLETEGLEDYLTPFQKEDKRHLLEILTEGNLQLKNIAEAKDFIQNKKLGEHRLIFNIIKILEQMAATPELKAKKNPAPWEQVSAKDLRWVIEQVVYHS